MVISNEEHPEEGSDNWLLEAELLAMGSIAKENLHLLKRLCYFVTD